MAIIEATTGTEQEQRATFVAGLRALADHYETTDQQLPFRSAEIVLIENDREQFAAEVRTMGGSRSKRATDGLYEVTRDFGPYVVLRLIASREEVCEAVVVGTETVIEDEIIEPAVTRRVERQRDKIEWRCAPVLAERDQIGAMS